MKQTKVHKRSKIGKCKRACKVKLFRKIWHQIAFEKTSQFHPALSCNLHFFVVGKRLKKCMHAYVINVFICFREKLVHRINANSVQYNFLKYIRINKSIIKVILVVPPLYNLCSPLLRSCSLASISFFKICKVNQDYGDLSHKMGIQVHDYILN